MSTHILLVIESDTITDDLAMSLGDILALTARTWTGVDVKCASVEVGTCDPVELVALDRLIRAHTG